MIIPIQVLFVDDDPDDLKGIREDLEALFAEVRVPAVIYPCSSFEEARALAGDPSRHFDLIISDTYRGDTRNGDAEVLNLVACYRVGKFTALVIVSSGVKPAELQEGPFLKWAGKTPPEDIAKAVRAVIKTGVPSLSRRLHTQLNDVAGSYLWKFLEQNWTAFGAEPSADVVERMIRRRAATLIAEAQLVGGQLSAVDAVAGLEYYVYPPLSESRLQLGSILRCRADGSLRVVLTPHCHLAIQQNRTTPKVDKVLTVKTVSAQAVIGATKFEGAKDWTPEQREKKLGSWSRPPSRNLGSGPDQRYWFMPKFLDIPYLYCDFLDLQSVDYNSIHAAYEHKATLAAPFAESLQANFVEFYGSVGIPNIDTNTLCDFV